MTILSASTFEASPAQSLRAMNGHWLQPQYPCYVHQRPRGSSATCRLTAYSRAGERARTPPAANGLSVELVGALDDLAPTDRGRRFCCSPGAA